MSFILKPLTAITADLSKIRYPVLVTPKIDGIRCLVMYGQAKSKSMKNIPNDYIRSKLTGYDGLDGELIVKGDFNNVQSSVMTKRGEPDFTYCVFDSFSHRAQPYSQRIAHLSDTLPSAPHIKLILPVQINNEDELLTYLNKYLEEGYEGIIIRNPRGKYKQGKSTVNEGILLKIKPTIDTEAVIVDITEKLTNCNDSYIDDAGYAKRSYYNNNLVPAGTAGAVTLKLGEHVFKVGFGKGITDEDKQYIWDNRKELIGKLGKFKYQGLSKDGIPRFGKLLCIRHEEDL